MPWYLVSIACLFSFVVGTCYGIMHRHFVSVVLEQNAEARRQDAEADKQRARAEYYRQKTIRMSAGAGLYSAEAARVRRYGKLDT